MLKYVLLHYVSCKKKCMFIGIFNHILSNKRNKTKTHRTQLSASSSAPRAPPGVQSCSVFFPRASERRVLPIVGVCKTSSHLHIFSSSHLLIFTSSHLHIFLSSHLLLIPHLLIFTSSHLHIFSSSHLLIFTSSHLHIFSSSHLLILTSSHPHIFSSSSHLHISSSSHLHISSSSHLHIFSSSHLLIFTSSHLHIFSHLLTSSHIFSHLLTSSHIFSHLLTSSHIFSHLLTSSHIFSSSHLLISHLLLLPSCSLLLFYFSSEGGSRGSANETARDATLSHEMKVDRQKLL